MKIVYVPTVAPWFSGIISVLSMPLSEHLSTRELKELYEKFRRREAQFVWRGQDVKSEHPREMVYARIMIKLVRFQSTKSTAKSFEKIKHIWEEHTILGMWGGGGSSHASHDKMDPEYVILMAPHPLEIYIQCERRHR